MLAMCILFVPAYAKVCSRISDPLSQALCNLSLAFLADSTALTRFIAFSHKLHGLEHTHKLHFVCIQRHDHSIHMSSVLQAQQLYTAVIPLLEAYLVPMANHQTRNERLSQEQIGR